MNKAEATFKVVKDISSHDIREPKQAHRAFRLGKLLSQVPVPAGLEEYAVRVNEGYV